ncbi:MAG: FkbM family methyltransferase [Verrucomicrobiia bacterium]
MLGKLFAETSFEVKRCRLTRLIHHPRASKWLHPAGFEPHIARCLVETNWDGPVWDVGANVGNLAYQAAQRHTVFAFEPNLNLIYYLAYKLKNCPRATVVPCALTLEGKSMQCSIDPNFTKPNRGPLAATLSVEDALKKCGRPGVIKLDIEGGEYEVIKSPFLTGLTLIVEWHREVPTALDRWHIKALDPVHTLLTPK